MRRCVQGYGKTIRNKRPTTLAPSFSLLGSSPSIHTVRLRRPQTMKRWISVLVGFAWLWVGCSLEPAGTYTTPVGGQGAGGQGGSGQGGAEQGGGGSGQGGQGGSIECKKASDCPAPSANCAVMTCKQGVCVEAPDQAGSLCRASASPCDVEEVCDGSSANCPADAFAPSGTPCSQAASSCDAVEVCDGLSPTCAPDTGPAAACTSSLPITYSALERTFTITSINLAGTGKTVATVSPGAQVTLQVLGSWQRMASPSCPGCITQFYVSMNGIFSDCADVSGQSGSINRNITFAAPQGPGIYFINPGASWEFNCLASPNVGTTFQPSTIATLVVQ